RADAGRRQRERQRHHRDGREQQRLREQIRRAEPDDERERGRSHDVIDDHELHSAVPIEERAADRADEQAGREREKRDRARESGGVESVEREEDEDQLDHRRRGSREQHAADESREAGYLEETPVARPRLGGEFGYRATLPNQTERSLGHTRAKALGRPRFLALWRPDRTNGAP